MKVFLSFALLSLCVALPAPAPAPGDGSDVNAALKAHNDARAAAGTPPLVWDHGLASDATAYAQKLSSIGSLTHSCQRGGCGYGENLYYGWKQNNDGLASAINYMIKTERSAGYCASNHFTQIVWRNTKRVGMGMANSSDGKVWVVARYVTPGNVVGQCATTAKN